MGLKVHLFIEARCNFGCKHCFTSKSDRRLTAEDVRSFLDWLSVVKIDSVNIVGSGNPLLNPEFEKIVKVSADYGRVTLNFRGDIDDDKLLLLKDYDVKVYYSIDRVNFTDEFYGVKGIGAKLWDYLAKLINKEIETYIRTTIMRENYFDAIRIMSIAHDMSIYGWINGWYGMPYVPHIKNDPLVPTDRQLLNVLEYTMGVTIDGDFVLIHPVTNIVDPKLGKTYKEMVEPYCWTCGFGKKEGRICLKEDCHIYGCAFDLEPINRFYDKSDVDEIFEKFKNRAQSAPVPKKCSECWLYLNGKCKGGCIVSRIYAGDVSCPIPAMND